MGVAAFALVLSVVSLVLAFATAGFGLKYSQAADERKRERAQREKAAAERERNRERREEAAARASLEARPTAGLIGHDHPRSYKFWVKNIGHAAATDLEAVLIDDGGEVVAKLPSSYVGESG